MKSFQGSLLVILFALSLSACSPNGPAADWPAREGNPEFWAVHGIWFLVFMNLFPRITMIVATVHPIGWLSWLGWLFAPRYSRPSSRHTTTGTRIRYCVSSHGWSRSVQREERVLREQRLRQVVGKTSMGSTSPQGHHHQWPSHFYNAHCKAYWNCLDKTLL